MCITASGENIITFCWTDYSNSMSFSQSHQISGTQQLLSPIFFPSQNPVMNMFNISGHSSFFFFFYLLSPLSLCLSRPEWQLRSRQEYIKWVYFIGRSLFPSSVESFAFHSRCFDFFSPLMFVFPHEYCKATECTSFATESASIRDYCLWL